MARPNRLVETVARHERTIDTDLLGGTVVETVDELACGHQLPATRGDRPWRRRCPTCGPVSDTEARGARPDPAPASVYALVDVDGGRVAHVRDYLGDDPPGAFVVAACGKAGRLVPLTRGSHVFGGLRVCYRCARRSHMARHLRRAVDLHRHRFTEELTHG